MKKTTFPPIGVHESISGGHHQAVLAAAKDGFDCVQLFSKNSNQWKAKPIPPEDAELFKKTLVEKGIKHPLIHDSYLINLASPDEELLAKSIDAFRDEIERAEILGIPWVVMHPGTPTGDKTKDAETEGLKRIAKSLDTVFKTAKSSANVQLETTAGQGANLGWRFEHLAKIIECSEYPDRLGVCIDTCHIFAAGYPLVTKKEYEATMNEFDRVIGLDRLKAFHLNDIVKDLGCRVDRHAQIGHGKLGLEPFRHLLNDPRFVNTPMYIETPKGTTEIDGEPLDWDVVNLKTLQNLVKR